MSKMSLAEGGVGVVGSLAEMPRSVYSLKRVDPSISLVLLGQFVHFVSFYLVCLV